MPIIWNQAVEERQKIVEAFFKSLLPAVLADTDGNLNFIHGYLQNHGTDANGITDFSLENLNKAVKALEGQLRWDVPPAKRPRQLSDLTQSRDQDPIRGITPSESKEHIKIEGNAYDSTMQVLKSEHDKQIVSKAQQFIDSFGGRNMRHAQRFEAQDHLLARWNELLQRGTKPEAAFEALKSFSETLFPTDLGSIR